MQDTFDIYKRDFSAPTGEDKFDKQILPKVMQLRKGQFGRAGRTKWTHLTDQDTTLAGGGRDDSYALDQKVREKCARAAAKLRSGASSRGVALQLSTASATARH